MTTWRCFSKLQEFECRRQVYCGYMGRADLVTDCCVYEAKVRLTSHNLKYGAGQAIIYRDYIDKKLTPVVMGSITRLTNECVPYLADSGVAVLGWKPMKDYAFTTNLCLLEGLTQEEFVEFNDRTMWRLEVSGERVPGIIDEELTMGVSAIEEPINCPLYTKFRRNASSILDGQRRFREDREKIIQLYPLPMEGLPNPKRIRDDRH